MSAFDVRTGTLRWSRALENPIMTSPIVVGRNVIVGEGNDETYVDHGVVHVGGGRSALVAFDRETGSVAWTHELRGTGMPTPALVGGDLIEHDGNSDVVSLDPATGIAHYIAGAGTAASMSAVVPLDAARFAIAGQTATSVRGVNAADGSIAWTHPMPGASGVGDCPLALGPGRTLIGDYLDVVGDEAYVQAGKPNRQHVYAIDADTGAVRWDVPLEIGIAPRRNQAAIPVVDGDSVYVGSSVSGVVHALDVRSGRLLWRRDVGMYDHAIFAFHSLSFMTLLVVGLIGLDLIGVASAWLWLALILVPPIHMYKHVKGAYLVGRFGAAWRTAALLLVTSITSVLFFILLLWLEAN